MKAAEEYFPMVLFIMLYKIFLMFQSVDEITNSVTTEVKVTKKYFSNIFELKAWVLEVVLGFTFVD